MRAASSVLLLGLLLAACDRPQPILICHNANCGDAPDPSKDDTIETLEESLALEYAGRPALDGMEIDTFWDAAGDQCLFAHDLASDVRTAAIDAGTTLAARISLGGELTFHGGPLTILIELKPFTDSDESVVHTEAQLVDHAACVWAIYDVIADAAVGADQDVEVIFSSFEPPTLLAVADQAPTSTAVPYRFGGVFGIPAPLDGKTHPLTDYAGTNIDFLEIHPQWILDAQYEAVLHEGYDLAFWMFSATTETLQSIDQYSPEYVGTSEALLLRRWLEY